MKRTPLLIGLSLVCALRAFGQNDDLGLDLTQETPAIPAKPVAKPAPAAAKSAAPAVKPAPAPAPAKPAVATPSPAPAKDDVGLDLSSTADVQAVLIAPPIVKVTTSQKGGFTGFTAAKTTERFDAAAHKRLVDSFQKKLDGKAIPAEAAFNIIVKEGLTPATLRTPAGVTKLCTAANVKWLVTFDFDKSNGLFATISDAEGKERGTKVTVANATGITQKHADEMAELVAKQLIELTREKPAVVAVAPPTPVEPPVQAPPPAEEEQAESDLSQTLAPANGGIGEYNRIVAAVGPGAAIRSFKVTGVDADRLAELRNNPVVGLAFYGAISPLQFFTKTAGKRWSDLEIEVNYRHAFVRAEGVGGGVTGQTCAMTDDDLQVRGTWRFKVVDHTYGPQVGVGGGWSREQTLFSCTIPLLSASYSGIDAQLRVRQPLYRTLVSLDLAGGPRFLMNSGGTGSPKLNLSGEAWIEARPISLFFARAGVRASKLNLATDTLVANDTRVFAGAELGAFF